MVNFVRRRMFVKAPLGKPRSAGGGDRIVGDARRSPGGEPALLRLDRVARVAGGLEARLEYTESGQRRGSHHASPEATATLRRRPPSNVPKPPAMTSRAVHAAGLADQIGEQLAGKARRSGRWRSPPNPRPGRRIHRLGHGQHVGTLSTTRKQRCATYQHACERFSGVSDERPAPRPRCAAGTGGSRADRRTTRPACRSARRQCPSVHPAAQWCALRRRPTDGRR